jgi:hypothetical protein
MKNIEKSVMRKRRKSFARNGNENSGNGKATGGIVRERTGLSRSRSHSLSPAEAAEWKIQ